MSLGKAVSNKNITDPYKWVTETVKRILADRQYTGCTVNFKSTILSYKVHKKMKASGRLFLTLKKLSLMKIPSTEFRS